MKISITLSIFFLGAQLLFSQVIESPDIIKGQFKVWHPVTIAFKGPQTSETATPNPFTQYRLDVTFKSPSGKKFKVPGYYAADGKSHKTGAQKGNIWLVKFPPNEPGTWNYKAHFVKGTMIAGTLSGGVSAKYFDQNSGSFTINPTDIPKHDRNLRGKGKLEYVGEHYLRFQGSDSYFMKAGANSPEVFLEYAGFDNTPSGRTYSNHISDWKPGDPTWNNGKGKGIIGTINYLAYRNINAVYFLTNNHEGDGGKAWPWINTKQLYRYDCSKLAQWDKLFKHFDRKGMMLHFVLTETENEALFENVEFGSPAGFSALRKIYYRELVARFGYHLAITWNIGEENGWNEGSGHHSPNTDYQRKVFAEYLKKLTYYNDHIVVHNGPSTDDGIFYSLLGNKSYSGPSFQWDYEKNVHNKIQFWRNKSAQAGRKWVVSMDEAWTGPETYSVDHWRKEVVWGTIMAGGAGSELYIGAGKDIVIESLKRYDQYYKVAGIAAQFMQKKIPFQNLNPNDGFIKDGWTLKNKTNALLYLKNGGTRTISLPKGEYTIQWFDPRNGGTFKVGSQKKGKGGTGMSIGYPPNNTHNDWIVWIKKATSKVLTPITNSTPPDNNTSVDENQSITQKAQVNNKDTAISEEEASTVAQQEQTVEDELITTKGKDLPVTEREQEIKDDTQINDNVNYTEVKQEQADAAIHDTTEDRSPPVFQQDEDTKEDTGILEVENPAINQQGQIDEKDSKTSDYTSTINRSIHSINTVTLREYTVLEVRDISGRLVTTQDITSLQLPLRSSTLNIQPGAYIITLINRNNTQIVPQSYLSAMY